MVAANLYEHYQILLNAFNNVSLVLSFPAISTVVTVVEILKNNGLAVVKSKFFMRSVGKFPNGKLVIPDRILILIHNE